MNRRLLALLVVPLVPWSVVIARGEVTLVFAFGLVDPVPLHFANLYDYLFVYTRVLPEFILAWPVGVVLYAAAVTGAVVGVALGREDHRVTGLLLVLAGLTQVSMALGFSRRAGYVALPVGTVLCLALAWWFEWPAVRETLPGLAESSSGGRR